MRLGNIQINTAPTERRLKSRVKIAGRLAYYLEDSDEEQEGELEDLSNMGARIWIKQHLPLASELYCRVEPDDSKEAAIEFTAILLHSHPECREPLYGYGCAIKEIKLPD